MKINLFKSLSKNENKFPMSLNKVHLHNWIERGNTIPKCINERL